MKEKIKVLILTQGNLPNPKGSSEKINEARIVLKRFKGHYEVVKDVISKPKQTIRYRDYINALKKDNSFEIEYLED